MEPTPFAGSSLRLCAVSFSKEIEPMATFIFRCPNTDLLTQGWSPHDSPEDDKDVYTSIRCVACGRTHYVNAAAGQVFGEDAKKTES